MNSHTFARFSYKSGWLNAERVHWRLFEPPRSGHLSIFSANNLSVAEVSDIGERAGQQRADRSQMVHNLYGWACVGVAAFNDLDLKLKSDNGHVNVVWTISAVQRKDACQKLARRSRPRVLAKPVRICPR